MLCGALALVQRGVAGDTTCLTGPDSTLSQNSRRLLRSRRRGYPGPQKTMPCAAERTGHAVL